VNYLDVKTHVIRVRCHTNDRAARAARNSLNISFPLFSRSSNNKVKFFKVWNQKRVLPMTSAWEICVVITPFKELKSSKILSFFFQIMNIETPLVNVIFAK